MNGGDPVRAVLRSRKYRGIDPAVIAGLVRREQARESDPGRVVKAVKGRLHEVHGAFWAPGGARRLEELLDAAGLGVPVADICRQVLGLHISTGERQGYMAELYQELRAVTGPVASVQDWACGLHPFALPWMGLVEPPAPYYAYDIDRNLVQACNRLFALLGFPRLARVQEVVEGPPASRTALAFLLKFLTTAEAWERGGAARVLASVNADYVVVSFALESLGGRRRPPGYYLDRYGEALIRRHRLERELRFSKEMFLVLRTNES